MTLQQNALAEYRAARAVQCALILNQEWPQADDEATITAALWSLTTRLWSEIFAAQRPAIFPGIDVWRSESAIAKDIISEGGRVEDGLAWHDGGEQVVLIAHQPPPEADAEIEDAPWEIDVEYRGSHVGATLEKYWTMLDGRVWGLYSVRPVEPSQEALDNLPPPDRYIDDARGVRYVRPIKSAD